MERWIAGLLVDEYPPEAPNFRTPLVLLHGLWTGSWCWHTWATHFSNLGWECWAPNFRGRVGEKLYETLKRLSFSDCVEDVGRLVRSCSLPPVVLGINIGAVVALKMAEEAQVSALILACPSPPQNLNIPRVPAQRRLRLKYFPLLLLRRPFRLEEKDLRTNFLASLPENLQVEVYKRTVPESIHLIQEFFNPGVELETNRLRCPIFVLGGNEDIITPVATSEAIARWLGADFTSYSRQGHWIIEHNGEVIVRDIHRWIVQKLGDKILLAELS